MSNTIWNSLRTALSLAGERELAGKTFDHNLSDFRGAFEFPG
jgi:hypothetical protein